MGLTMRVILVPHGAPGNSQLADRSLILAGWNRFGILTWRSGDSAYWPTVNLCHGGVSPTIYL